MKKTRRGSLSRKVLLPVLCVGCVVMVVGIGAAVHFVDAIVKSRLQEQAGTIASAIANVAMHSSEASELQRIVSGTAAEPGVKTIILVGGTGDPRVIACSDRTWLGKTLDELPNQEDAADLTRALASRAAMAGQYRAWSDEFDYTTFLRFTLPELARFTPVDGAVKVSLATDAIRADVWKLFAVLSGTAAVGLLFVIILAHWLFYRHVLGPLNRVERQLAQGGDALQEIDSGESAGDQIGTMVEALNASFHERKAQNQILAETTQRMQSITAAAYDAILMMDSHGAITYWNPAAEKMFGYSSGEAIGMNLHKLLAPARYHAGFHGAFPEFVRTGRGGAIGHTTNLFARTRDGREIPVQLSLSAVSLHGDWHAVGILRDMTEQKRLELELAEGKERLEQLAAQSRTFAWEVDTTGLYVYVSPVVESVLGYQPGELVGRRHFYDVHPEEGREEFKQAVFGAFERKETFVDLVNTAVTKDGRMLWLSTNAMPLLNADGTLRGYRGSDTDVTERKRAEEALARIAERLALATEAGKVGIWDYDVLNNRLTWDAQMFALYGTAPHQFSGAYEAWRAGIHPEDQSRGDAEIQMALRGEMEFDTEFRVLWPDGSVHNIRAIARVTRDASGAPLRMFGTNWDITEQKRSADNLLKINRQLEDATAKAQRAAASKSEFLANMSHEIRTPMAAVVGLSDLLSDTVLTATQRDYVERIHLAGTALVGVLNDILDYSKIEAGHMRIETVPMRIEEILDKCNSLFGIQVESKKLALRFELAPSVPQVLIGDPLRLLQVISNLVGNALKFTKSGGIDVGVECLEQTVQGVLLKVRVKDTGIGLTPDQRERLFGAFQQGDRSTTREYGGTGLGLSISKRLAELMGGEIGVESVLGEGSTFWFTARLGLPAEGQVKDVAAAKPGNSMADLGRIAAPIRGARVLIVDDSSTNLLVAKTYLRKMGLEAETADNGQTAVNLAKSGSYDAILMDLQMPGMDGFAASRMIREQEAGDGNPAVPIIALTAAVMNKDMRATEGAGMNDHVSKPVEPFALAAMLVKWIPPKAQP